jgi:phospholipid-transporting ATPase
MSLSLRSGQRQSWAAFSVKQPPRQPQPPDESPHREVLLNAGPQPRRYAGNTTTTTKYSLWSFVPRLLLEQFSRAAYIYFAVQAGLAWWATVSPYNPWGSTLALAFVVAVAAAREAYEDAKRRAADSVANGRPALRLRGDGAFARCRWRDVCVGDVLLVNSGDALPADCLCLFSSQPERTFVQTANLDGETSLKEKAPVRLGGCAEETSESEASRTVGRVLCDPPSASLRSFSGSLRLWHRHGGGATEHALSLENFLPRGCTLKVLGGGRVVAAVLYAGVDTKILRNQKKPPFKSGAYQAFLNAQIWLLVLLQVVMCLCFALADWAWHRSHSDTWYLDWRDEPTEGPLAARQTLLDYLTFWCVVCAIAPLRTLRMMTNQISNGGRESAAR